MTSQSYMKSTKGRQPCLTVPAPAPSLEAMTSRTNYGYYYYFATRLTGRDWSRTR